MEDKGLTPTFSKTCVYVTFKMTVYISIHKNYENCFVVIFFLG